MPTKKADTRETPVEAPIEAPILPGYEGATYQTVTLTTSDAEASAPYRVATPIPQAVAHGGATYLLADRALGLYVWQPK
jgi:hypothetical protein